MGAPDPENPLFLGLSVLRGGFRPSSQTMVSEGARPWGRGRFGDCENTQPKLRTNPAKIANRQNYEQQAFLKKKKSYSRKLAAFFLKSHENCGGDYLRIRGNPRKVNQFSDFCPGIFSFSFLLFVPPLSYTGFIYGGTIRALQVATYGLHENNNGGNPRKR